MRNSFFYILIAGLFLGVRAEQVHAANLLHQWTFNSGDGMEDITGNAESLLRGNSTLSNGQLLIPASPANDGLEFDTGGVIDLDGINSNEDGVSFIVWCTPDDYSDQKFVFEIGTKSFLSLNANNNPYPRGGVGTASATADEYSISLSSKPADGSGSIMLALTLADNENPNTDEAYLALYTGPSTLFGSAASSTLEFTADLGSSDDIKLLGDSTYGPFNITGSIDEFRIYGGVLSGSEIAVIAAAGPAVVLKAYNPDPYVGEQVETKDVVLSWDNGISNAVSFDVYAATDMNAVVSGAASAFKTNQPVSDTEYGPLALDLNSTYYWRIDLLDGAGEIMYTGTLWHFFSPDGTATDPIPADGARGVLITRDTLQWTPGAFAESQNLYFSTDRQVVETEAALITNGLASDVTSYQLPIVLEYGTTCYWRVDAINPGGGISTGSTWRFTVQWDLPYNDITFLVVADQHYGVSSNSDAANRTNVDAMNAIIGTAYPASIGGGTISAPRGVLVCGDFTDNNDQWQMDMFRADYGTNGEGRLAWPTYEGLGNHDGHGGRMVTRDGIAYRNLRRAVTVTVSSNGYHYSWDWDGVHFVNLNLYPGIGTGPDSVGNPDDSLAFLQQDLPANVGNNEQPVVIMHHYGYDTFGLGWWSTNEQEVFYETIADYNIVAIFGGHNHSTFMNKWRGFDTYNAPRGQPLPAGFYVVHIAGDEMTVAARYTDGTWGLTDKKSIAIPEPGYVFLLMGVLVLGAVKRSRGVDR